MIVFTGIVIFLVSLMAFFSGFGLGTVFTPVLMLFMPLVSAIALTAIVHFLTSLMKCIVLRHHIDWHICWKFGIPALLAAIVGARLLTVLSEGAPSMVYHIFSHVAHVELLKVVMGILLFGTAVVQKFGIGRCSISRRWMPVGGLLSGFLGGLSGYQGAVRSIFLSHAVKSSQQFIATSAAISLCVDSVRLVVYGFSAGLFLQQIGLFLTLYITASALAGVAVGAQYVDRVKLQAVRNFTFVMLCMLSIALIIGVL